jgi:hypothetical protein
MEKKRLRWTISIAVFLVSFIVYLATLAPTISWGDSAEFVTVAYTMGIAHPSGYPLYTLISKLFTYLPVGSIAYRVNLVSALFGSLTVMLVFLVVAKITSRFVPAILSSAFLAFSFVFWSQVVRAEVYALNAFFLTIIVLLLIRYDESRNIKFVYYTAFIYGLSLTNHLLSIILALPIIYFVLSAGLTYRKILNFRVISFIIFFFLLGLTPYLYLPLRSSQNPILDWGNPATIGNLVKHVSGYQYKNHMFVFSWRSLFQNVLKAFYFIFIQFIIFVGFTLVGMHKLWKMHKKILIFMSLIALIDILVAVNYDISDIIVYYIPCYIIIAAFIGIGVWEAGQFFIGKYVFLLAFIMPIIMLIFTISYFGEKVNLHSDTAAYAYARAALFSLPRNSIIITDEDDEVFPLWYAQFVENSRKDVIVLTTRMFPSFWYPDMLKRQHPELIVDSYDTLIKKFVAGNHFTSIEALNKTYTTDLFIKQAINRIISDNNRTHRVFNVNRENISQLTVFNKSILKEIYSYETE